MFWLKLEKKLCQTQLAFMDWYWALCQSLKVVQRSMSHVIALNLFESGCRHNQIVFKLSSRNK